MSVVRGLVETLIHVADAEARTPSTRPSVMGASIRPPTTDYEELYFEQFMRDRGMVSNNPQNMGKPQPCRLTCPDGEVLEFSSLSAVAKHFDCTPEIIRQAARRGRYKGHKIERQERASKPKHSKAIE